MRLTLFDGLHGLHGLGAVEGGQPFDEVQQTVHHTCAPHDEQVVLAAVLHYLL